MSVIRSSQYPGRWNTPDADSPQGSGKNRTAPGSNDGSYFDQVWFNDMDSLHQALFIAAGVSPNGVQDVGTASQIFDALINNRWSSIGNYSIGTVVTASDGNQYYCNQSNGRDSTVIDPVSDVTDSWRQYPAKITEGSSFYIVEHFDGRVEISYTGIASDANGISDCTFPNSISLSSLNYRPQVTDLSINSSPLESATMSVLLNSKTVNGFNVYCLGSDGTPRQGETPYVQVNFRK